MANPDVDTTRYIAFEGVEGAGKSSVSRRVAAKLRDLGHEVVAVREPGGTTVGEAVREILLERDITIVPRAEAALFAAARAQLIEELVVPALRRGAWVLSDRTVYSSLAYQAGGRGLAMSDVEAINDFAIAGVWPSTVVLLDVDHATGLTRQSDADRIGREAEAFHADVRAAFRALAADRPQTFVVVDAHRSIDEVVWDVLDSIDVIA